MNHPKYSSKINRICCENRTYFLVIKNQTIPSGVQIRKSFDESVIMEYYYHSFVELQ